MENHQKEYDRFFRIGFGWFLGQNPLRFRKILAEEYFPLGGYFSPETYLEMVKHGQELEEKGE